MVLGNGEITEEKCVASEGFVEDNSDCEDGNAEIHPDASEVCDEIDNDCDDLVDDDDNSVDVSVGGIPSISILMEMVLELRTFRKFVVLLKIDSLLIMEIVMIVKIQFLLVQKSCVMDLNNDCSENGDLTSLPFDEIDDDGDGFVECEVVEWKGSNTPLGGGDCDDEDPLTFVGSAQLDSETLCMRWRWRWIW